ncbi:tannase/feruloyl esterase family alpha/beta hydrolase [Caenimonas sedimenti]|uniref:tannase/feruloyl esterase family alpha/beta hydrolase n=1 Tax=Caenimonas sedimenti TaxID=2596921 RepID=UPI00164617B0|nr:tannase/feruloyl esterase family alpha/beta hydrolase [Caenimonas sedimenti]
MQGARIDATRIGLPTRGAVVDSSQVAPAVAPYQDAEGEHLLETPARCLVLGRIEAVDPAAPPIRFAINLPLSNWNGRALQSGGGGLGGQLITAPRNKASGRFDPNPVTEPYPITRGYVTFGSDNGHPPMSFEWSRSDEAMRNFAHEELKKTKDVAMAVIVAAYGRKPSYVFFNGESAGAREALRAAQVYPQDYDGVIATSPVLNWNANHLSDNVLRTRLVDGFLDVAAVKLVADDARARCDAADGLADGVIGRYLECPNDLARLTCRPGVAQAACLTPAQIDAVRAHREPYAVPVPLAHGVTHFPGYRVTGDEDGARWQWRFYVTGEEPPSRDLTPGLGWEQRRGGILNFASWWVRHGIARDPAVNPVGFDPKKYEGRIRELSTWFDATDPDLSRFAARGGKLIIIHPSADNATPLSASAEYVDRVVQTMGQQATDRFLRFYVPVGGSHNVGGTSQLSALTMLEDWVLRNQVPSDAPVAYDLSLTDGAFRASRPACRYPTYPHYKGAGDVKRAESFECRPRAGWSMRDAR